MLSAEGGGVGIYGRQILKKSSKSTHEGFLDLPKLG